MSLKNIRAGHAEVELSIRDKITQGLSRAQGKLRAFAAGMRTIRSALFAGLGGASILGPAKIFADVGSALHDMSQRTGVSADKLSELKYAAEQTGATLADVERGIKFMQKQGIDASKFDEIAAAVSNIADDTERAQVAWKIFGRTGAMLLPMFKDLPALRERARALGASLSPEQAEKADALGDAFGDLKTAMLGLTMQMGAALAPVLIIATNALVISAVGVGHFATAIHDATAAILGQFVPSIEVSAAIITGLLNGLMPIVGITGAFNKLQPDLQKLMKGEFRRTAAPDFGELDSLIESKGGGSSRGTFHGGRAGALAIGSGGGVEKKLDKIADILAKINVNVQGTTDAVEEIEGLEFE